jgi:sarcosine oxidase, subunit gamma
MRELVATPLLAEGAVAATGAVIVEVTPAGSYVHVQISRRSGASAPVEVLGAPLPTEPGTCSGRDPIAWWLAPDTWLVASSQHDGTALVAALESACAGRTCAIVDVSDSLVALKVRGPSARELLSRGTGFDVRAASFGPGRATRVAFAQLPVLLRPITNDSFELLVDRSAARWLADWLSSAASTLA